MAQNKTITNQFGNQFEDKVAFITGGSTGIGFATAQAFANQKAKVVIVGIDEEENKKAEASIKEQGGDVISVKCDVQSSKDIKAALAKTIETFGRLDFAFNNAGVEQPSSLISDVEEEDYDKFMGVDLKGVFLGMKYEIPLMLKTGGGVIVNTSSGAGVRGIKGQSVYCAAKHAVIGMSRAAALDYADQNIRVNIVAPGYIETPMMTRFTGGTEQGLDKVRHEEPIGRPGKPEEIASAVLWFCSEGGGFATGSTLVVDGGQTI